MCITEVRFRSNHSKFDTGGDYIVSIFIYEDNMIQAQHVKQLVESICERNHIQYDFIKVTSKADNIIRKIPHTTYVPIYFLDIEIKSEDRKGLEVAKLIRQYDEEGMIVFVTTHTEFAPISYEYMVSALTFIDKSLPYDERYTLFEQSLLHYKRRNVSETNADDFIVQNKQTTIKVPFKEVQYVMTGAPHRLTLVTTKRYINFYGTLKEIEKIDDRLFRCHQSYVVNVEAMKSYDAKNRLLTLQNNEQIYVSRRLHRSVQKIIRREY